METGYSAAQTEERRSAKVARLEDKRALEEEKRRKKEKEQRKRAGA